MGKRQILTAFLIAMGFLAVIAHAAEKPRGDSRFATTITSQVGGKPTKLVLTGTAMRTYYLLNVYAIGSYVQEGTKVRDADALARADVPKQLHLIFERDVDGGTIAQSFREAISMSHPAPAYAEQLAKLEQYFRAHSARRGDHVRLTHIPGVGLGCQAAGHPAIVIKDPAFAHAAWEVYLGRRNLGVAIRSGLTSRL